MNWPFGLLRRQAYGVIYADCPWQFVTHSGTSVPQRARDQHYQTMTYAQLAALPVYQLAAPDCALFMWGISSHLPEVLRLGEAWGFSYASKAFTWAKMNKNAVANFDKEPTYPHCNSHWFMGLGYGTRRNTEDCWLFTRGNPKRMSGGVRELIVSPVREHSRKPDETYDRIESLYSGPRCELFARNQRNGWHCWGNETQKF